MTRAALAAALVVTALGGAPSAGGEFQSTALPVVVAADVPVYPRDVARDGVAGTTTVRVRVVTDGRRITTMDMAGATPALANLTALNLKTWRFAPHSAATLDVVFRYTIVRRSCDSLGLDTRPVATLRFPADVEVIAEVDSVCDGVFPPPPTFGVYITRAAVPFYPAVARERGIEGDVRIGMSAKGELTIADGPVELGEPTVVAIRGWLFSPPPFAEELRFTYRLVDGDCRSGGPTVIVGPHLSSFDVTARRGGACGP